MPIMSEGEFYRRKIQYKLTACAHLNGYILSRFLIMKVKEAWELPRGAKPSRGLGAGALVSGGPLAKPMEDLSLKKEKKEKKREKDWGGDQKTTNQNTHTHTPTVYKKPQQSPRRRTS